MDITQHNPMQLHQIRINFANIRSVGSICRYISLETNYTIYINRLVVGKLSIIMENSKISTEVMLYNFSLTHCMFDTLSTTYCLKHNQTFHGNKTNTQSTVEYPHRV